MGVYGAEHYSHESRGRGRHWWDGNSMESGHHKTAGSWGLTDNGIVFRGLRNRMIPKAWPVSVLIEQGGGNVGGMGLWRPLSGGIAALWTQTICAIISGNLENGYFFKTGPVKAIIKWGGIDVGGMGVGVLESAFVGQHSTTIGSDY
ncbi:hypothetical protein EDD85DRAFT_797788 [Armillaria nabsnona]|nr:hypothetical protein EDD85DRAFT_797788 [Armillaria nabsnona]